MTPSLALWTSGEFVLTTMPGWTGHAHDATGLGAFSTSTKHIRPILSVLVVGGQGKDAYSFLQSIVF
jgi:hypothetical protein